MARRPGRGARDDRGRDSREIRANASGRAYHLRLFRVGMRAAADMAEVARARRDAAGERRGGQGRRRTCGQRCSRSSPRRSTASDGHGDERDGSRGRDDRGRTWRVCSDEPAVASWADAADRWRARENPYLVAYCRWREAEALLGDGDRGAATDGARRGARDRDATSVRAPLATADRGARRPGRGSTWRRTRRRRSGARRARRRSDPFGLTRRERDVLPLLVKGRTNRQIAEELFISENTAGVHVSNILGKLGASTRTEAAGDRRDARSRDGLEDGRTPARRQPIAPGGRVSA